MDCTTFTPDACNLSCTDGRINYASLGTLCGDPDETMQTTGRCDGQGHCVLLNDCFDHQSGCATTAALCSICSMNQFCKVYNGQCTDGWYDNETGCGLTEELCSDSPNSSCYWNGTACVIDD